MTSCDPIVATAREHYRRTKQEIDRTLPPFGSQWTPTYDRIANLIDRFGDSAEVIRFVQKSFAYDHRMPVDQLGPLLALYDDLVRREFPWFSDMLDAMREHPDCIPETLAEVRGRPVSNIMFWHARYVLCCLTYIPQPKRIIDIGGGYGASARLWLGTPNPPSYCIIDTPETLFFAEVALAKTLRGGIEYFDGTAPRNDSSVVLVPLPRLHAFPAAADLVINTASMQEMTDEWIDFYMRWLDAADARFFYSLNHVAQPVDKLRESRNLWGPRPSALWATRYLSLGSSLVQAQTRGARHFQEVIYEKGGVRRTLSEWAALRGRAVDVQCYAEGLDLLRQSLTVENASQFLRTVCDRMRYRPKELLWLCHWLRQQRNDDFSELERELEGELDSVIGH
jgi:putative sugar O-methyltransferase